ncbi:MAG: CopG family transcriptional regulator [Cyanobacteriota bacterium]|nr:CopG family transcriptional regulator [Cyanobacteriota bacterium]
MALSLPIRPLQPVRVSTDLDTQTAKRLDRLATQYGVKRAELIRAALLQTLEQHEDA